MSTDHNRIKVADLEKNQQDKILVTDANGELEFQDIKNIKSENYNALDYTTEGKALDARQGKVLKDLIDTKTEDKSNKTDDIETNKTSSVKYTSAKSVVDWLKSFLFPNLSSKTTTLIDTDLILTGDSEDSFKTKTGTFAQLKANLKTYFDTIYQSVLVSGSNIKTVNGTSLLGNGNIATPDMNTTTAQTVSGVKTFLNLMLGLRNAANTFTSFITNAATASRTWTFPDKSGTVAMTSDITGVINAGTTNRIPKYVGSTVVGNSRIQDTGNYLGIDTINTPVKDIALGNQANKEIGIEQSDSITIGRELIVSAGRTINFQLNSNFVATQQSSKNWSGLTATPNGDIYACVIGGDIYKQASGTNTFLNLLQPSRSWDGMAYYNGDVYAIVRNGDLYKQTGGIGNFVALGKTARNWYGMCISPINGDIYAVAYGDDIYIIAGGIGDWITLSQGAKLYWDIAAAPNGDIYAVQYQTGNTLKRTGGSGNFNDMGNGGQQLTCTVAPNGDVYVAGQNGNGNIFRATSGSNTFVNLNQTTAFYQSMCSDFKGNIYAGANNGDIYKQTNNALGTADLNGGTIKTKAGTGKGTGKSYNERYTGQKTLSGTDMQIDTLRDRIDENGYYMYYSHPTYANDADADTDANLPSKAYYKINGNRGIFQKP